VPSIGRWNYILTVVVKGEGFMRIDVVSDVVCPWCFIGKRQLEAALSAWGAAHPDSPRPEVVWHPFQLNPVMPPGGADLRSKFGSADTSRLYGNALQREVTGSGARSHRLPAQHAASAR
jgi:predicted DsbA family dithiol-disulfide isomerase